MIDIRHRIKADDGFVRVLRLTVADGRTSLLSYDAQPGPGLCQRCGCTDEYACPGGCAWVDTKNTLCSQCLERELLP